MKCLSIILFFSLINCEPKKKVEVSQHKNSAENSVEIMKDSLPPTFKNDIGLKTPQLKNDTSKNISTSEKINDFKEADAAFQWDANQKLEKLLNHFGKNTPDYYAGAYINDKGNLVINIKGNLDKGVSKITKIIGKKNIIFKQQQYSYKELSALMDYLNDFATNPKNKQYSSNMKTWGLNELDNIIEMGLKNISPEKIKEFKAHISNSAAITFHQSDGITLQ